MEQIKLTQTWTLSSAGSVVGESADGPASVPTAIDKRVIVDKVLGVRRGHYKGIRRIAKSKGKAPATTYLTLSSGP